MDTVVREPSVGERNRPKLGWAANSGQLGRATMNQSGLSAKGAGPLGCACEKGLDRGKERERKEKVGRRGKK
jgi:hypothetical protein